MSTVYEIDTNDVRDVLAKVLGDYHPNLSNLGVKFRTVKVLKFDKDDEPVEPSLKHHGAAAAGTIKVLSLKQRQLTGADVLMELDGHRWKELPMPTRLALVDHELTHLVVVEDRDGRPKVDDIGRPKLKTRPDDWTLTGFLSVINRHGTAALEYQSVTRINEAAVAAAQIAAKAAASIAAEIGGVAA